MNELNTHYGLLLGLNDTWEVVEVNVDPEGRLVEIQLRHRGGKLVCPDCQQACPLPNAKADREKREFVLSWKQPTKPDFNDKAVSALSNAFFFNWAFKANPF